MSVEVPERNLPAGTVTFLFTDIQGSTELLKQLGEAYATLLSDQRQILRTAFEKWDGSEIDTQGDAFFASFPRATQAVAAVVEIQRALATHDWPSGVEVRVRMGLHTGEPWLVEEGYVGMDVHRAARIAHVGHGGQVLLSETTAPLVQDELPEGVALLDLSRHRLKDLRRPEHLHQLVIEGLPSEFSPLKSLEILPPAVSLDMGKVRPPDFLQAQVEGAPPPVFVGRERELARLNGYLERARGGQGGLVFITGGPGRGKTALMEAFARQAMEGDQNLLVAAGKCNAYTGSGDPYAPFREVLGDLSGDVGTRWAAGAISSNHATRLWEALPYTAQALVDHSPDLVEAFISGVGLLSRASQAVPEQRGLLQSLRSITERDKATPGELEQKALFEQYLNVLSELAARFPLLIQIDDMQWADTASLNLLFHLGRKLSRGRIFLLCTYRPEEVALGRGGERHPLEEILAELKRLYGEVWIDLSAETADEGRTFVDNFLDSEPNRFSPDFRQALYAHAEGHPLFTIELLREMQARGDLVQDERGYWLEGDTLNWNLLPARVEGVIEARIGRLENELRKVLTIASVEGEDFTAQVIARVQEVSERGLVHQLSGELDRVHRLVKEQGARKVADHRLFLYRFQHQLFQKFLYNGLGGYEREMLHAEIGSALEELYGDNNEEVAAQLAWHFSEAGEVDKAIHYSLAAGDRARAIYAYQEAIDFYQRAIELLKDQGDDRHAARTLMKLGLTYHTIFDYRRSREAYDEAFSLRKRERLVPTAALEPAPHPFRCIRVEPHTFDPTKPGSLYSSTFISNLFSGLVGYRKGWEINPDVARSWEISEDGRRYRFHLRDDVTWSDGEPVTAGDFVFTWKRMLDPSTVADESTADFLYDVKYARDYHMGQLFDASQLGIKALDATTLEVELERPASYFLHLLTRLYPVPRHVVEAYRETWTEPDNLVSNGPFLLDSYQPGESIILARNPGYHGRFPGNLEMVEVILNLTDFKGLERYESNGMDVVDLSLDTIHARHRHVEEYASEPFLNTRFVQFDTQRTPFDDSRVRQAFVLAVDRERLVGEVSLMDPATSGLVPPGMPGHSPGIALPYNPDRAHQLLAQAGYPDGQGFPNLRLEVLPGPNYRARHMAAQWLDNLNIEVALEVNESGGLLGKKPSCNFIFQGWTADYPDPYDFLGVFTVWHNDTYERLLDRARRTTNQGKRIQLYQAADKILIEEAVIMPVNYGRTHRLVKPWAKIPEGRLGYWSLKDVVIEPH